MRVKRVLVVWGARYPGSHLRDWLVRQGRDVLCVDDYFSGVKTNIVHLAHFADFKSMRHDVTSPLYVDVDETDNLACPASPRHDQFDPVRMIKTGVVGAINMLGRPKVTLEAGLEETIRWFRENNAPNVSTLGRAAEGV